MVQSEKLTTTSANIIRSTPVTSVIKILFEFHFHLSILKLLSTFSSLPEGLCEVVSAASTFLALGSPWNGVLCQCLEFGSRAIICFKTFLKTPHQ